MATRAQHSRAAPVAQVYIAELDQFRLPVSRARSFLMCHTHSCSISTFATFHFLNVYFRIFFHPDGFHENGERELLLACFPGVGPGSFPPMVFLVFFGFDSKTVQRSAFCRSRRELSNAYLLAKFVFDTAENEPFKVR